MTALACSQCGRPLPDAPEDVRRWKHGDLVLDADPDEATVALLLCPVCVEDDRREDYEAGEAG